jgi:hypothetical protein
MILTSETRYQQYCSPLSTNGVATLPEGAALQRIAFAAKPAPGQEVLLTFPPPIHQRAVVLANDSTSAEEEKPVVTLLLVPSASRTANQGSDGEFKGQMQHWVEAAESAAGAQWMTFQGTQICWSPQRCAILAPAERLESVKRAVIEVYYYESELNEIERSLGEAWPAMEADMPLAFEFTEKSVGKHQSLQLRFQQALLSRARLARLGPFVHTPHLHPPTLASQIGERFRERTRMVHRYEFLGEQFEVFERVYEMCGQRASDYRLARTGHMLEWVIIVLLVAQLLLAGFELLTSVEPASAQPTISTTTHVES